MQAVRRTGPAEQRALGFLRAIGQALQPGPLAQVQQVAAVLARQAGDGQAGRQVLGVFEADVGRSRRQAGRRGGGEGRPGALGGVFLAQRAGVVALRCERIEEALAVGGADHVQVQAVVFVQAFHQRQSEGFQLLAEGWQEILGKVVAQALQQRLQWWDQDTPATRFKPGRQFTPYGGLIWDFARDWSWYVSYAEVYQPQADRQTWNSEPLSPVEGKTYETGIKGELADGRLNLSLAAFRIDLENNPQEDPDHPGPPNNPFYISGGKVRSQGFELEGTGYLTPYWSLSAGYTYTSTEYLKDSQNDSGTRYSTFTPRHLLRLWSNYDLPWQDRRWSVGGGLQAQSDYSVDYRGVSMRQGGYALVNMRLGYKIDEHWTAAVNVNNLFDRTYYQSLSNPNWNNRYGEPRSFNVSLRGAF